MRPIYSNELWHYQVPGAKHGVRRYQYKDGSYTPLGRIHYGIGQARARREAKQKEAAEAKKNEAIRSGSFRKIKKEQKNMSSEEFKEAIDRASRMADVPRAQKESMEAKRQRAEVIINSIGTIKRGAQETKELVNAGIQMYNLAAGINNAISKTGKKLPILDVSPKKESNNWYDEAIAKGDWDTIEKKVNAMSDADLAALAKRSDNRSKVLKGKPAGNKKNDNSQKQQSGKQNEQKPEVPKQKEAAASKQNEQPNKAEKTNDNLVSTARIQNKSNDWTKDTLPFVKFEKDPSDYVFSEKAKEQRVNYGKEVLSQINWSAKPSVGGSHRKDHIDFTKENKKK